MEPHPQQPNPKRPKMSTTTTTDLKPRYKRRKIAILFAYCGVGYQGMQKNPGAKTIEADLEEALYFSGAVPDHDRGKPKSFDFARSARTDKGVSAVGQVVSGRFYIDPPGFIERLNSNLPSQIRIFGFKRVTNSFSAKKFCDRRRYVYLLPVFALDPSSHRDRESVLASLGSDNQLVKCLECSDRGRKVEGVMGKRCFESKLESKAGLDDPAVLVHSGISTNSGDAVLKTEVKDVSSNGCHSKFESKTGLDDSIVLVLSGISTKSGDALLNTEVKDVSGNGCHCNFESTNEASVFEPNGVDLIHNESVVATEEMVKSEVDVSSNGDEEKSENVSEFRYGEKEKERFNRILSYYVGTHNFHNLTTRTKAEDPSAQRFIVSFEANTTITIDDIEFIKCEVVGQSFMLHQIRKMVGLAVAIMRNCAPESLIETALQKDVNITVPTAPEVGLYLDECFFTSYNQKWKDTHEEVSMAAYADEAEDFKIKNIYSHIASTEHKEGVVGLWLHSLNHRNYSDLQYVSCENITDVKIAEADNTAE